MENEKQNKKSLKEKFKVLVKTYLTTGLVVIIPLWLTYFVVATLFKWVGSFALPAVSYCVSDTYWQHVLAKILSFFGSIICILILGFIANRVFGKRTLGFIEKLIEKLPILGTVHSTTKQFVNFIFGTNNKRSFKQVVFVYYPNKEIYSVAFLTGVQMIRGEKRICVFMPTTPNPTSGFLLLVKEEDVIYTNYSVEQAFQFIISAGVIDMDGNSKIELKEEIAKIKEVKNEL
ncbi:membrane protein [Endomicrobiia bacterium]|nr:membrane protein [Endomicrobiia bacterium]GHT47421.1 membrane protein [Endomicrobiia bacterium]